MLKTNTHLTILICLLLVTAAYAQTTTQIRQLTLDNCVERAMANHPLLKAAQTRLLGNEEYSRYIGVRPNPTVTVQTENWRAWQQPSFAFGRDIDLFIFGTQRLETAGKATRRRELAERQTETAQSEIDLVRRHLRQEITRAYWNVLQSQMLLEILSENRGDLDQLVQYTGIRVREGYTAESELIRARLERQTVIGQQAATEQALERARLDLLRAMGETSFDTAFKVSAPQNLTANSPLLVAGLEQLRADALRQRPELIRLRAKVEAERANLRLQQSNARPDWELSAGYKRTGGYNTFISYVTVPLPFFNKNRAEIGRAAALISSAEQELLAEENYIRAEVESAYRAAQKMSERLTEMQRDFLQQADESRNIALVAYREGAMDLYKLLETQRARNDARLLYYRTLQEFQFSLAELALTVGGENK